MRWIEARTRLAEDLRAMQEGRPISRARVAMRLAVHARWRAVVLWRLAQLLATFAVTKPVALWLTDVVLAFSGAELQPTASIGGGVVLKHTTGLVVGGGVVAGDRLTLHQNVTLGDRRPFGGQPTIGDDVLVGAGACVLGPVLVGDRSVVAAGAVVLQNVPSDCLASGNPAVVVPRGRGRPSPDEQARRASKQP